MPWTFRDRIKHFPGLAHLQRFLVTSFLNGKEFEHVVDAGPAAGIKFHIQMPEDKGIWTGTYEVDFATRVSNAVKPGDVAYDIGGWHGFFSGVLAAAGTAQVHVFEPLPDNIKYIKRLVTLNPDHEITLHECAVGALDETLDLVVMPQTSMAKLGTSPFQADTTTGDRISVPVRCLDNMVTRGGIAPPDIMKIDVEGAEILVLKGCLDTLRLAKPVIFAEMHSSALLAEGTSLLESEGYVVHVIDKNLAAAKDLDVFQIHAQHRGSS
ncbi:methyltransferase, FkbM family domain protein [Candidatus Phaeomarinobacter ectocarpi]|uniref:Methyltransferase, FkbM family domain protein n=1 Tax=Candidatus Phaeomarinibacter ectocarpi TaxID=1458461 RepID=X5MCD1_9HYPH|nr:methyltransferase, FkbM family domain protein [Candidatus Phaeomarinobacter ectocarpi]